MKTLKFKDHLARMILKGEKTCTWRFFDDKDLKKDDELVLINADTGEEFARALILLVYEKMIGDIDGADFVGHEPFESEEEMYRIYKSYYGEKVNKETLMKIVRFRIL